MLKNDYMVIGADSFLGGKIAGVLEKAGKRVLRSSRRTDNLGASCIYLDLREDLSSWEVPQNIGTVFFCAAVTSTDECRKNPEESRRVNVENTIALGSMFMKQGTSIIFPSTSLVFDGRHPQRKADDPVCPVTEYGRQKVAAENGLIGLGKNISIVRLTKIIGPKTAIIVDWIEKLRNKRIIHPFSDKVLAPVQIDFAAKAMIEIAEKKSFGIWQISAKEDITYEQLAIYIARNTDRLK